MGRRAKGEGSVFKDKQGYWNAQIVIGVKPDGKPKYKKFRSKKQSVVVEKMRLYKLSFGTLTFNFISSIALDELLISYTENIKRLSIRATSYDSVVISVNQVNKHIGHFCLTELTPEIIQIQLINKMCDEGYAWGTVQKAYVILNECLKYAVNKEYISKNPCDAVKMLSKDIFNKKEIRFLTDEEIRAFKDNANSNRAKSNLPNYIYGNIICLVLYTGLRVSELCALKWRDINAEKKTASINKTVVVVYDHKAKPKKRTLAVQPTTKSGRTRVVPLNKKAMEIIDFQRKYYGGNADCFIVNGTTHIPDKTVVASAYTKIARAAKIDNPSGIHTLRHTFASLAIRKGVDIKVVSEILGHAIVALTYNTYVHIIDEQKVQAVELLEAL